MHNWTHEPAGRPWFQWRSKVLCTKCHIDSPTKTWGTQATPVSPIYSECAFSVHNNKPAWLDSMVQGKDSEQICQVPFWISEQGYRCNGTARFKSSSTLEINKTPFIRYNGRFYSERGEMPHLVSPCIYGVNSAYTELTLSYGSWSSTGRSQLSVFREHSEYLKF